jgi:prepilin-type N-terminal cleavage/methylation domain-containing protein
MQHRLTEKTMRKGFTLVELLVVITIIAMLMLVGAPAFIKVMERTQLNICENNHRMLSLALSSYAAENTAYLTFPNWLQPEASHVWEGPGWLYYWDKLIPGGKQYDAADKTNGALWNYIQIDGIYHCPIDPPPWAGPAHELTSYMMNGAVIDYGRNWGSMATARLHKQTDFDPMAIIFWESNDPLWNDGSSYPTERLTTRHRDGATVGCADGHVEYLTQTQFNHEVDGDLVFALTGLRGPTMLWCDPSTRDGH